MVVVVVAGLHFVGKRPATVSLPAVVAWSVALWVWSFLVTHLSCCLCFLPCHTTFSFTHSSHPLTHSPTHHPSPSLPLVVHTCAAP